VTGERRTSGIVTPEAVLLEFETAGVGSRTLAKVVDLIIQFGLLMVVMSLVGALIDAASPNIEAVGIVAAVLGFLVLFGYPIGLETWWSGRTVGKVVMGVRVVTREGAPARFRHAAIRGVLAVIEVFALPFIAVLTTAFSPANQRVGDAMAGTIVIRQRSAARRPVALMFLPPPGWEAYARSLDVSAMTVSQYRLVRSFLTRVLMLTPEARARAALRLAGPLARTMHHQPPARLSPELFLVCAASAYQQRHGGSVPLAHLPAPPPPPGSWGGAGPGPTGNIPSHGRVP
jgi:uncharacterized RDD family membrane protein YckC